MLFDVFAGVGPFAIPAAKAGCSKVFANDLNPDSYNWLKENCLRNKVVETVDTFNLDGAEFIRTIIAAHLKSAAVLASEKVPPQTFTFHIVMNLPAIAVTFLKHLLNLLEGVDSVSWTNSTYSCLDKRVTVHCYCFSKNPANDDYKRDALSQVLSNLNLSPDVTLPNLDVHIVRNVAPNKEMVCVSFSLPIQLLCSDKNSDNDLCVTKKLKQN